MTNTVKDHLGNEFSSISAMCDHYKISRNTYYHRLERSGWDLEKILTTPDNPRTGVRDHNGKSFQSVSEMCRYYGISRSGYESKKAKGMSLKEILTNNNSNANVKEYIDPITRVHYLLYNSGITPRLNADGSIMVD